MRRQINAKPAHLKDFIAVRGLIYRLDKMHNDARPDACKTPKRLTLSAFISCKTYIIRDSGVVVGVIMGQKVTDEKDTFAIKKLIVMPEYQHRGLASVLIKQMKLYASSLNYKRLVLTCWTFNETADKMYISQGFKPYATKYELNI